MGNFCKTKWTLDDEYGKICTGVSTKEKGHFFYLCKVHRGNEGRRQNEKKIHIIYEASMYIDWNCSNVVLRNMYNFIRQGSGT